MAGNIGYYYSTLFPTFISSSKNQIEFTGESCIFVGGNIAFASISSSASIEANITSCQNTFTPYAPNLGGKKSF